MNNIVGGGLILMLICAAYALGRAHRPRTPWQDGYQQGVADTTKSMFKTAVRVATSNTPPPGRFRPRLPWPGGRARGSVKVEDALKDEPTQLVVNPLVKARHTAEEDTEDPMGESATVRLLRPRHSTDSEAAA